MNKKEDVKNLNLFQTLIAGLGATLGIEFLVLFDYAIQLSGPAILLSLIFSGIINLLIMLNYVELSSSISRIGSEYTYTKAAFGGFICFLSGWLRWLSSIFTTTISALGFAEVVVLLIPEIDSSLFSVAIIALFTIIGLKGGKIVDLVSVLSFITIFIIISIFSGIQGLNLDNFHPFFPNGFYPGVLAGTMYTFNMYVGMRAIVTKSHLIKETGKTLFRAVLISTLVVITIYCGVAFIAIGTVSLESTISEPFLIHFGKLVLGDLGQFLVLVAWASAALMSLSTSITVQAGILSALSRDGYLPSIILSPKNSLTKYIIQIAGSFLAMIFAATGLIIFVGYASGFASLIVFALVNLSLIKLRKDKPELDRPFKTPLYPYTPIFGIVIAIALMVFVESSAVVVVLEFIIFALMIYYLRMMGNQRLRFAAAGINIGIGGFIILLLFLFQIGTLQHNLSIYDFIAWSITGLFFALIFLLAGILNLKRSKNIDEI